ncbi:M20 family metallopeptidase [Sphaerisporangium corydalis]|uniref:M20 family metallopeptidase n=1 Tax=Sphaerisporangium corydalis TaxID=1441875 RepID=A0ABV9EBX3_9ACTN|nr:M20/M25/M40 family metallo-hydrolase [Sphaerisporangium corydalis]
MDPDPGKTMRPTEPETDRGEGRAAARSLLVKGEEPSEGFMGVAEELLAVRSTADRPGDLRRALDLVLDFAGPGFTVERFTSAGKPSALVYHGAPRPRFRVILNAHLDVVLAPPEQFRPRRAPGRLYARGAQDMKVSALVEALVFRELAARLPYPIALQLVTDEEVGGRDGTLHQIERGVTGDFVIIGEQSGLRLVTDSKGMVTVNLRSVGRGAHGAYPWLGDNALLKLHRTLDDILARYPVATEEVWRTTVNVARVETFDAARNQVPALAEAWLDVRYPPQDADLNGRTAEEIAAYLGSFCAPGVTPVVEHVDPPHHADPGRPEVLGLQRAARNQGYDGGFLRKHGAADGRFYYQRGIDAVIFGVGGDGQHGPDEYVDTATITPYYLALTEFLLALSSP